MVKGFSYFYLSMLLGGCMISTSMEQPWKEPPVPLQNCNSMQQTEAELLNKTMCQNSVQNQRMKECLGDCLFPCEEVSVQVR